MPLYAAMPLALRAYCYYLFFAAAYAACRQRYLRLLTRCHVR